MENSKICTTCFIEKNLDEFVKNKKLVSGYGGRCKPCHLKADKQVYNEKGEKRCSKCRTFKHVDKFFNYRHANDGKMNHCKDCKNSNIDKVKVGKIAKKYLQTHKNIILEHYGKFCQCCGEATLEFLTIEHKNGNGKEHRQKFTGVRFYKWVITNNFPDDLEILCWNCNCSKGIHGQCPHKKFNILNL